MEYVMIIIIVTIIGFMVSLYAYYIEKKIEQDPTYKPICDLSDRISCSKPIRSSWGKLFTLSNASVGMVFYVFILLLYCYIVSIIPRFFFIVLSEQLVCRLYSLISCFSKLKYYVYCVSAFMLLT